MDYNRLTYLDALDVCDTPTAWQVYDDEEGYCFVDMWGHEVDEDAIYRNEFYVYYEFVDDNGHIVSEDSWR